MVLEKDIGQGHRWYFGIGEFSVRMSCCNAVLNLPNQAWEWLCYVSPELVSCITR